MTIVRALQQAIDKLNKKNITSSASLDAELLLGKILNQKKEFLLTYPETQLTLWQRLKFLYLIKQRLSGRPVAQLTKNKEFYGYNFTVNKNVLIPRPLTETMVDLALLEIKKKFSADQKPYVICDLGTGSGNLIISLALELKKFYQLADFRFLATDISSKALKVAQLNAKQHGLKDYLTFIKSNLFSRLKNQKIDLVMANLPYLDQNDLKEPSIKKEPWLALAPNLYPEFFRQVGLQTHVKQIIYEDKQGIHLKNLFLA